MERQKRRIEKTDKELREQNFTKMRVSKAHVKLFTEYCKTQHISKIDALHEIISFLEESKMPIVALKMKHDLNFMQKYHDFTTGVLKNFEYSFLNKLDKIQADSIAYLDKAMASIYSYKGKDSVLITQNFKLLRALVAADLEERDSRILLSETLSEVNEYEKQIKKLTQNFVPDLEGVVGKNPKITKSANSNKLYLLFLLGEKQVNSQDILWHRVVIWEEVLTKNLALKDEESIRNYFNKIVPGDTLKLKGNFKDLKFLGKDGKTKMNKTFMVSEIISNTK